MRVQVRPLRQHGRNLNRQELEGIPAHVGLLKVLEGRDPEFGRSVTLARLLDPVNGIETDILPELTDARLLWVNDKKMRIGGFERIQDVDYAQTWALELD